MIIGIGSVGISILVKSGFGSGVGVGVGAGTGAGAGCGSKTRIEKHKVFFGRNRLTSIRNGFIVPLCREHHTGNSGVHFNHDLDMYFKKQFQNYYENYIGTREEFITLIGKNYL